MNKTEADNPNRLKCTKKEPKRNRGGDLTGQGGGSERVSKKGGSNGKGSDRGDGRGDTRGCDGRVGQAGGTGREEKSGRGTTTEEGTERDLGE